MKYEIQDIAAIEGAERSGGREKTKTFISSFDDGLEPAVRNEKASWFFCRPSPPTRQRHARTYTRARTYRSTTGAPAATHHLH